MTLSIGATIASAQSNTASTSISNFSSQPSSILILPIFGSANGISGNNFSVSDTAGLTWANKISASAAIQEFDLFYAVASTGVSNDTITVWKGPGASNNIGFFVVEVDGADTTAKFDPTGAGESTTNSPAPSVTTANANDIMIVPAINVGGGTSTASYSNGYTEAISTGAWASQIGNRAVVAYKVVSATGTQTTTVTFTDGGNGNDYGYIIGLEAKSGSNNYTESLSQNMTLTGNLSKAITKPILQGVGINTMQVATREILILISNSIAAMSAQTKLIGKSLSNLINISSLFTSGAHAYSVALSQTLNVISSIRRVVTYNRLLSQVIQIVSSLNVGSHAYSVALSQTLGVLSSLIKKPSKLINSVVLTSSSVVRAVTNILSFVQTLIISSSSMIQKGGINYIKNFVQTILLQSLTIIRQTPTSDFVPLQFTRLYKVIIKFKRMMT